jgi:hypothetical protein
MSSRLRRVWRGGAAAPMTARAREQEQREEQQRQRGGPRRLGSTHVFLFRAAGAEVQEPGSGRPFAGTDGVSA